MLRICCWLGGLKRTRGELERTQSTVGTLCLDHWCVCVCRHVPVSLCVYVCVCVCMSSSGSVCIPVPHSDHNARSPGPTLHVHSEARASHLQPKSTPSPPAKLCLHALFLVRWPALATCARKLATLSLYYLVLMPSLQTSHVNFQKSTVSGLPGSVVRR